MKGWSFWRRVKVMCCTYKCCCITSAMISLVARKEWGRSWGRKKTLCTTMKKLKLDFNSFPCSLSGTPSSKLLPFLMRDPKLFLGQPPYGFLSIAIRFYQGSLPSWMSFGHLYQKFLWDFMARCLNHFNWLLLMPRSSCSSNCITWMSKIVWMFHLCLFFPNHTQSSWP